MPALGGLSDGAFGVERCLELLVGLVYGIGVCGIANRVGVVVIALRVREGGLALQEHQVGILVENFRTYLCEQRIGEGEVEAHRADLRHCHEHAAFGA